ncbi:MAG: hypothetical protein PVH61_30775 [Candidatus Aminicenantes bacterium]
MKKTKLKVRDEAKQHLKEMYDILKTKHLSDEHLAETTAGNGCGALCQVTCAYFCRPACETQCERFCITGTMMDCDTRCGLYKAMYPDEQNG